VSRTLLRHLLHWVGGLLLYEAIVFLAGILAALATPAGYFAWFGRDHRGLAMGLWSTLTFALPCFLFALAWVLSWRRLVGLRNWGETIAFLLGALTAWLFWQLSYFADSSAELTLASFMQLFWATHFAELWHIPSAWAVWAGIALGLWWRPR
jgi:hypothetical protein